ncbi:oxygen-independent coproporphyrinogen III oxidase [Parvibaculum sp.]|uniref:oxygen-independent coproporphyrinogen III oxidase n=1 Tax=Parvibaculum sp. TaxID=2024848 RepID=UPI000C949EAD|nr:oxygen-independent coproporphyrinogen III oxidase [Parvibaculum sp.]MAB13768.1 oxygen-independent coproporphyrinogen III oxidase [Parvibaculum sp.]
MRLDLIEKYDLRVPRYTSYPTAPHFGPSVDGGTYARWLSELEPTAPLSLYLHIAYCAEMCWFCGCHTKATHKYAPVADYLDAVQAEAKLIAGKLPARMKVDHVHFGGGSPTLLKADDFAQTLAQLREFYNVTLDADIAVEMDPRTATEDYVRAMAKAGVTRASIGVQDFDERVQKAINRIQPYDVTARVSGWLRDAGISAINMDLVYGLPYQTVESVTEMARLAAGLAPARIALFGYAHVPWMKPHQKLIPEEALPDMAERWAQYEATADALLEAGYVRVGLDHFAHPDDPMAEAAKAGALHRNFQGYTTDEAPVLIALGASGIGSLPQGYVANEIAIERYKETVRAGELPITRGIAVNGDDKLRREIIEKLMCDMNVDLAAIAGLHGLDPDAFDPELAALEPLEADGIVLRDGSRLVITEEGRPLMRAVCAVFDRYLEAGGARHSKAV